MCFSSNKICIFIHSFESKVTNYISHFDYSLYAVYFCMLQYYYITLYYNAFCHKPSTKFNGEDNDYCVWNYQIDYCVC